MRPPRRAGPGAGGTTALEPPDFAARLLERIGGPHRRLQRGRRRRRAGRRVRPGRRARGRQPPLDSWIAIAEDGSVTAYTGKCELGQGLYTAQTQLIAEELDVPLDRVTLVQCDTDVTPDQGTTSGAQSHPTNFNRANLALAAATARDALVQLASERLGVPADQLEVEGRRRPRRRRSVPDGDLRLTRRREDVRPPARPERQAQASPRVDRARQAGAAPRPSRPWPPGRFEFVHNVRVPGMLHGQVVRPPAVGATLVGVDEGSVRDVPGLVKVVVKKNFVGVVAEKPWQAIQAANKLKVAWTRGRRAAQPTGLLRVPAAADSRPATRCSSIRRTSSEAGPGRDRGQGHLPSSVSDARIAGQLLRRGRRAGRQGHDLVADARRLSAPQHGGDGPRPAARRTCASSSGWAPAATGSTAPRPSPTTPRCCRRPSASRSASSSRARTRWPGRTTGSPSSSTSASGSTPKAPSSPGITRPGRRRSAAGRA